MAGLRMVRGRRRRRDIIIYLQDPFDRIPKNVLGIFHQWIEGVPHSTLAYQFKSSSAHPVQYVDIPGRLRDLFADTTAKLGNGFGDTYDYKDQLFTNPVCDLIEDRSHVSHMADCEYWGKHLA